VTTVEFPNPTRGTLFVGANTTRKVHFAWTQGRALLCQPRFRALSAVSLLPWRSRLDDDDRTAARLIRAEVEPSRLCRLCFCQAFRDGYAVKYAAAETAAGTA
jgi:hypothetical protein